MTEKEMQLLIAIIVGAIALIILVKFWRIFISIAIVGGLVVGGIYLYQQSQRSGHGGGYQYPRHRDSNPRPDPQQSMPSYPTALPDLTIASVSREPRSPIVRPGTTVRFYVQVRNIGNAPAHGFVRVFGPGNHSGGFSGGLNVGETKVATVGYPVHSSGTTYRFTLTVDAENTIQESNENNNTSSQLKIQTSH